MDRGLTRTHSSISAPGILVVCNTLSCGCAMALSVRKLLACAPKGVQRGRRGVIRRALALCQGFGGVPNFALVSLRGVKRRSNLGVA